MQLQNFQCNHTFKTLMLIVLKASDWFFFHPWTFSITDLSTYIIVVIEFLLQVMWWIIHCMFCNWDLPNLADGASILSPLQACVTYGKLLPTSLFAICSFCTEKSPSSVKLKSQTVFCSHRRMLDFLQRDDQFQDMCHQPAVQLIIYTRIKGQPKKCTLSNWLSVKQPRQTNWHWVGLFGSAALRLCKCQSANMAESLKREGFLVLTIVLLSRPSGKQVGAQLRYRKEKIIPL